MSGQSFPELLQRTGARPGHLKRWWCPKCEGKTPALSVDGELYHCHRCGWGGGRRALENELGIESPKPGSAELRKRRMIHIETERFAEWAQQKRMATAALLRDLNKHESVWREAGRAELQENGQVSERIWARLHLAWEWNNRAEVRWNKLCNFEDHAGELYQEFSLREKAA